MISENNETSGSQRLVLDISDKINLKISNRYVPL